MNTCRNVVVYFLILIGSVGIWFEMIWNAGIFIVQSLVIILTVIFKHDQGEPIWVGVRLYRGFLLFFLNIYLIGLNIRGWQRAGVNHVLIFEIDPRDHLTWPQLLQIGALFLGKLRRRQLIYSFTKFHLIAAKYWPCHQNRLLSITDITAFQKFTLQTLFHLDP